MTEVDVVEANLGASHSPLVSVSFQKNEQRKFKYLEGEPKALGITQICLSIFQCSCVGMLYLKGMSSGGLEVPFIISSFFILIAGSVAIAAKNLHLPTVKSCMGMEILAVAAAFFNLNVCCIRMNDIPNRCYGYFSRNQTELGNRCQSGRDAHMHLFAELVVVQVALLAISATLVAYASKVVNCCSPPPKVAVVTIQNPTPP